MPSKAKLTTRGISTTTVTTDTLPKNLALTNNELDSNFINLRDQTFAIVGDDSSGIDIKAGDTIKFTGAGGATVTASGDTITVTAGGGGGGLGNLQVNDTTLSPITTNSNIKLEAHGTGEIELISQQIILGDNPVGGTVDLTTASAHQLNISINNNTSSSRIEIIPSDGIFLNPNGSEKIKIDNNYWPNTDGTNGQTLITDGAGNLSWSSLSGAQGITFVGDDSTGTRISDGETVKIAGGTGITTAMSGDILTITATGSASTGDLTIVGSEISGPSNGDISITPGGTGNVVLKTETLRIGDPDVATEGDVINIFTASDQSLYIATSNLDANSASIKLIEESGNERIELTIPSTSNKGIYLIDENIVVGRAGSDKNLTSNGAGDLILNTNLGTNSGNITIADGANGNISITPNGTGSVVLDGLSYPQSDGTSGQVLTTNGSGQLSFTSLSAFTGITFVGDDSTGSTINTAETFKIVGGSNITTAVSGDTLTITGPNLTGYAQKTDTAITIVGDDSTGTSVTLGETFKIAGGTGITTAVGADTLFINVTSTSSVGDFTITGTTISAETTNANITITSTGTGNLNVDMDTLRIGDSGSESNITTNGTGSLVLSTNNVGVNSGTIKINEGTNGNIELAPNGTGDVLLTADTVRVGDSNADATITTNGTGDLILNTNSGTNSGTITIADGTNGTITVATNGTGYLDLHKSFDSTNFPQTPASGNTNWAGATSATYAGTRMLYSNQALGDITDPEQRVRANTRLVSIKHPNDSTTYNDTDYVIQNTDVVVIDINGQPFGSTLTGARGAGVRGEANNVILKNTAGGTKTGPNLIGGSALVEVDNGHGGDLTAVNVMGFRSFISNRANTGEFTRMTNAYGFIAEGIAVGGSGASGTNRFVTNEYGFFSQGSTSTSLSTNYYGFYANTGAVATNKYAFYSADDAYLSRLGTIERVREKQNALTSSSTITVDADLAPVHKVTLAENTQFGITGLSTGQTVTIIVVQDGVGNRTATFTSDTSTAVKFAGGTPALSTAANAIDVVKIYNDGTNFLGVIEKAFA